MAEFGHLPARASSSIKPFQAHIPDEKLQLMRDLIKLTPIPPSTFENSKNGTYYGTERSWLERARDAWLDHDWRQYEARINSYPSFKATVKDDDNKSMDMHFFALFSKRSDAIPLAFLHGWPGSNCEFMDILDLLKSKYTPETLPYHIIAPSLPGYGFSGGPPIDSDYNVPLAASTIQNLMSTLSFEAYLVQGGDLGSFISRVLALKYDACRGMHLNMMPMPPPDKLQDEGAKELLKRAKEVIDVDLAFALEQGSRPSTLGLAIGSNPLSLLAWLGEKFLAWTDDEPAIGMILDHVSLYWLNDTYPRVLWHNRGMSDPSEKPTRARMSVALQSTSLQLPYVSKPCGYSLFAKEIVPVPKALAEFSTNLVSFNEHDKGGHFAAMERPEELLADVEQYVSAAWAA